ASLARVRIGGRLSLAHCQESQDSNANQQSQPGGSLSRQFPGPYNSLPSSDRSAASEALQVGADFACVGVTSAWFAGTRAQNHRVHLGAQLPILPLPHAIGHSRIVSSIFARGCFVQDFAKAI